MDLPGRRIKVSTETRVRVHTDEKPVTVLGLSARDALLFAPERLGDTGDIVEIYLPGVGVREVEITAGIARSDKVESGHAVVVEFIIAEPKVRAAVNDLLRLLLAGDGGGTRKHPRITYDVPIRYGQRAEMPGRLEEISFSGMSIRVAERMSEGQDIEVLVPQYSSNANLTVTGKVVQQRPALEGGYHTGVVFPSLAGPVRAELARLLADLLCR